METTQIHQRHETEYRAGEHCHTHQRETSKGASEHNENQGNRAITTNTTPYISTNSKYQAICSTNMERSNICSFPACEKKESELLVVSNPQAISPCRPRPQGYDENIAALFEKSQENNSPPSMIHAYSYHIISPNPSGIPAWDPSPA